MENVKSNDKSFLAILVIIYQIGIPIFALIFLVGSLKKVDGVLEFIGYSMLASFKALFWPITMFF